MIPPPSLPRPGWMDAFWTASQPEIPTQDSPSRDLLLLWARQLIDLAPDADIGPLHLQALSQMGLRRPVLLTSTFIQAFEKEKTTLARCLWQALGSGEDWSNSLVVGLKRHLVGADPSLPQRALLTEVLTEALSQAQRMLSLSSTGQGFHALVGAVFEDNALDLSKAMVEIIRPLDLLPELPARQAHSWLLAIQPAPMMTPHADWIEVSIRRTGLMDRVNPGQAQEHLPPKI